MEKILLGVHTYFYERTSEYMTLENSMDNQMFVQNS